MSTLRKGIRGGTISGNQPSLCRSCRNSLIRQGAAESQTEIFCTATYPDRRLSFEVYECTEYDKRSDPQMKRMEDVAWILRTNPKQKGQLGFYSPQDMKKLQARETPEEPL